MEILFPVKSEVFLRIGQLNDFDQKTNGVEKGQLEDRVTELAL